MLVVEGFPVVAAVAAAAAVASADFVELSPVYVVTVRFCSVVSAKVVAAVIVVKVVEFEFVDALEAYAELAVAVFFVVALAFVKKTSLDF